MRVVKYSGDSEKFSKKKLAQSLRYSGIQNGQLTQVLDVIQGDLYDGITTKKLFQIARNYLKKYASVSGSRYNLKSAILGLGPTGYPFEKYIGELLKAQGFEVMIGVMVKGKCVTHEIDVVAEKEDQNFMIECKFHNRLGYKTDVKVPLCIHSRFKDVEYSWRNLKGHRDKFHQGWVVTNGKFTKDAIDYGKCAMLRLISWDYPKNGNLKQLIDQYNLHPITSLSYLTNQNKSQLLDKGVILCKNIFENPSILDGIVLHQDRKLKILKESRELCAIR